MNDYEARLRYLEQAVASAVWQLAQVLPPAIGLTTQNLAVLAGSGSTFTGGDEGVYYDRTCGISLPATMGVSFAGIDVDLDWDAGAGQWVGGCLVASGLFGGQEPFVTTACDAVNDGTQTAVVFQLAPPAEGESEYTLTLQGQRCPFGAAAENYWVENDLPDTFVGTSLFGDETVTASGQAPPSCNNTIFLLFLIPWFIGGDNWQIVIGS